MTALSVYHEKEIMTDLDLSSILSKPAESIKEPPLLPNGIYSAQVDGFNVRKDVGQNKSTLISFDVSVLQALDVPLDPDQQASLPRKFKHDFWITDAALYRFKDFLEKDLGIEGGSRTLGEMLPEAQGRMCKVELFQSTYTPKDGSDPRMICNIRKSFPIG